MNCELLTLVPEPAGGSGAAMTAARFQELLQNCSPQSMADQYVAPPPMSGSAEGGQPLFAVLSRLEKLELPILTEGRTSYIHDAVSGPAMDAASEFEQFSDAILQAQGEILRVTLMMETLNSAKQGVTTLFQLQG